MTTTVIKNEIKGDTLSNLHFAAFNSWTFAYFPSWTSMFDTPRLWAISLEEGERLCPIVLSLLFFVVAFFRGWENSSVWKVAISATFFSVLNKKKNPRAGRPFNYSWLFTPARVVGGTSGKWECVSSLADDQLSAGWQMLVLPMTLDATPPTFALGT